MKDFIYYRCSGSDRYRFGGEAICDNKQIQGKYLETSVWRELCELLANPRKFEQEYQGRNSGAASLENIETLTSQRGKLQHALERLIDGFTEGLIDKDQFTSRMARTKDRIADLDARINVEAGDANHLETLRLATKRFSELSLALGPALASADWHRRREIIRTLIQRAEIGPESIRLVFRVAPNAPSSSSKSIWVTLPRSEAA